MQKSPNAWSCGIVSLAHILDLTIKDVIMLIGHEGSEKLWCDISEPGCRKGFHVQELVDVAYTQGYALIDIQANPYGQPSLRSVPHQVFTKNIERLTKYLEEHKGLIYGKGKVFGHICAWDGYHVVDPRDGRQYDLLQVPNFQIQGFLALVRMN